MKKMYKNLIFVVCSLVTLSCGETRGENLDDKMPLAPDYTQTTMWFMPDTVSVDKEIDVFYIAPTCVWDWKDDDGNNYHFMDVWNEKQRKKVTASDYLAYKLLGESGRFYAPYYRQITMNAWMLPPSDSERLYKKAHEDVKAAFDYYMKHWNHGRPFVLAGHSQGGKAVIELLKSHLTETERSRMIVAYAFGFKLTKDELAHYPGVMPARDSLDTGVLICFNSVSDTAAVSPLLRNTDVCINPLNWRTDTVHASSKMNKGTVFVRPDGTIQQEMKEQVGVRIDSRTQTLVTNGIDPEPYYVPSIGSLFPKGNFHVQELNLYFRNIQENLKRRIESYKMKKSAS